MLEHCRNSSYDCHVGHHVSHDSGDDTSMAMPLDSRLALQRLILGSGAHVFFCGSIEDQPRWVGSSGDLCSTLHHHVYLALWYSETL